MAVVVAYAYPYAQVHLTYAGHLAMWHRPTAGLVLVTLAAGLSLVSLPLIGRLLRVRPALRGLVTNGPTDSSATRCISVHTCRYWVQPTGMNFVTLLLVLVGLDVSNLSHPRWERVLSQHAEWPAYVVLVRYRLFPVFGESAARLPAGLTVSGHLSAADRHRRSTRC